MNIAPRTGEPACDFVSDSEEGKIEVSRGGLIRKIARGELDPDAHESYNPVLWRFFQRKEEDETQYQWPVNIEDFFENESENSYIGVL